jgi:hypothetical protein
MFYDKIIQIINDYLGSSAESFMGKVLQNLNITKNEIKKNNLKDIAQACSLLAKKTHLPFDTGENIEKQILALDLPPGVQDLLAMKLKF